MKHKYNRDVASARDTANVIQDCVHIASAPAGLRTQSFRCVLVFFVGFRSICRGCSHPMGGRHPVHTALSGSVHARRCAGHKVVVTRRISPTASHREPSTAASGHTAHAAHKTRATPRCAGGVTTRDASRTDLLAAAARDSDTTRGYRDGLQHAVSHALKRAGLGRSRSWRLQRAKKAVQGAVSLMWRRAMKRVKKPDCSI